MIILLVDDLEVLRRLVGRVLKRSLAEKEISVEIIEAKNGKEAIQIIQSRKDIDIVITDTEMSEMNGVELSSWIRDNTSIPVILQSIGYEPKAHKAHIFIPKKDTLMRLEAILNLCTPTPQQSQVASP